MADPLHSSEAASAPRVGVVTVAFRSNDVLERLLDSLPEATTEAVALVVVDNYPGDDESAAALAHAHGATYVSLPENPGYGTAANAGVRFLPSSVEWVLICNPDLELLPGAIDALLAVATNDSDVGSVGPLIRNTDGSPYPSARRIPSIRTGVGHALFAGLWPTNPWTRSYRQDNDGGVHQRDAGWLSGACVLVRRAAFEHIGGFNTDYFMYFEDVDLGFRLSRAGWRNVYVPSAEAVHIGGHSTAGSSARMIRAHHDSARRFLSTKYPGPALWPVRAALSVGLTARSRVLERVARRAAATHSRS